MVMVAIVVVSGLLIGQLVALHGSCHAGEDTPSSLYFQRLSGLTELQNASTPVILGDRLYIYTNDGGTYSDEEPEFQLWRAPEDNPNDPWQEIKLKDLNDPNATATVMGAYGEYLYVATTSPVQQPHLWRMEDPNGEDWTRVTPSGLSTGVISALSSLDDRLYLGIDLNDSGNSVSIWRSKEVQSDDLKSGDWEQVSGSYRATISSAFQKFENKLYLGVENAENKAEVWSWDGSTPYPPAIYNESYSNFGEKNHNIAALAASDYILYAVTRNDTESGPQLWSMARGEENFKQVSSSYAPVKSNPSSLENLGSYLFLSLNTEEENEKGQIWLSYYDPNLKEQEKQWKTVSIYDKDEYDKSGDKSILGPDPNNPCWLCADQSNGYLYLGRKNSREGFTLWKSSQLPIITITSAPAESYPSVSPSLGAFNSTSAEVRWTSTRAGDYMIHLLRFTDPNNRIEDPNISIPAKVAIREGTPSSLNVQNEGTYLGEIAWDPNQSQSVEDQERYPVRFSFICDTTDPNVPEKPSLSVRNERLDVTWIKPYDKLSGVKKYNVWWKEAPQGADANTIKFNYNDQNKIVDGETEIDISGLANGKRYAVAVSAIDTAGNESRRSRASFATPELGKGLMDLVGETGGCFIEIVRKHIIMLLNKGQRAQKRATGTGTTGTRAAGTRVEP